MVLLLEDQQVPALATYSIVESRIDLHSQYQNSLLRLQMTLGLLLHCYEKGNPKYVRRP